MASISEFNLEDEEQLCLLGAALYSPARIQVLKLLYFNSYSVGEIAEKLAIPTSSAALYVRSLEKAGLINTTIKQGSRGSTKICSRKRDLITIRLTANDPNVNRTHSIAMPVGCFTDCRIVPGCGIVSDKARIGPDDQPEVFYLPGRVKAQLIWSAGGYVEYRFPYQIHAGADIKRMTLSFEACSETYNYNEDWPSDITLWIDGLDCGTWRCPGDFGSRRGRLNPEWWNSGSTQYGKLTTLEITQEGCFINSRPSSGICLADFSFDASNPITVRMGNKPDAEYVGGFNLFGERFGDYEQNVILTFFYGDGSHSAG
jgi:predicted transcriptional regulator